ncbi:Uncharacterized protein FWK35_00035594 [Aphis craccivora]|uniref:Uncharacterized protein n=1 Tax=Aphis craccivora TaxID=307492 RepID=A0A6G0VRS8_APHCR|nr:Uncharacterized protein FWK35_00035594 [Aphis craccivora]
MCTSTSVSDSESILLCLFVHTKSGSASVSSESYNKLSSSVSSNQLHTFCILSDIITRNYKKNYTKKVHTTAVAYERAALFIRTDKFNLLSFQHKTMDRVILFIEKCLDKIT